MSTELHLEGVDAILFYTGGPGVPDAVHLGSGEVFTFLERVPPKGGGDKAALYKYAKVAEFPAMSLQPAKAEDHQHTDRCNDPGSLCKTAPK